MKGTYVLASCAVLLAVFTVHCASSIDPAPQPEATDRASEALCGGGKGGGLHPGCGVCSPDGSLSIHGTQTCWTCSGDSYEQDCIVTCGLISEACCNQPLQCWDKDWGCFEGQCAVRIP